MGTGRLLQHAARPCSPTASTAVTHGCYAALLYYYARCKPCTMLRRLFLCTVCRAQLLVVLIQQCLLS